MAEQSPGSGARRVVWVNRFFHPDESATSIMLTDLVRDLALADGWQHHLVTSNARYATNEAAASRPVPEVTVHRIPALGSNNNSLLVRLLNFALFYLGALIQLLRHVRKGDVLVCLTDPPLVGVLGAFVARLKGARLVHWVQDIFPETASRLGFAKEGGFLDKCLRHLRNSSWRRASANVAIGENMRDYLAGNDVERSKIQVIQNWAKDEAIRPVEPAGNRLRREWGFSPEDCVIGYSGNLGRAHEIETKIAAMHSLHRTANNGLRFLFIGGGARQQALRMAAAELPDEFLSFRPYQPMEMLAESLSVPDVHWISLQPQLEGLIVPSKLYGALAVGRPVVFIGDPKAEVARLIAEGECGASFIPGEDQALARYIAQLAQDRALRERLGTNARSYLEAELTRSSRIAEWHDLLVKLA